MIYILCDEKNENEAREVSERTGGVMTDKAPCGELYLYVSDNGISINKDGLSYMGDFTAEIKRLKHNNLSHEMLIKASRIKDATLNHEKTAIDATAGMGDDSLLLAAAGFNVYMYEYNPVIYTLLKDTVKRALRDEFLLEIAGRMHVINGDSTVLMKELDFIPDVVLIDPMFPQRKKSGMIKKKFQLLQCLESPCANETEMMESGFATGAKRIIVKRPANGPLLSEQKPDYQIMGNSIRYDCYNNCLH